MDYFKKVGRPTDEEQAVVNMIEALIKDKKIPRSEIPHCQTLDDLLEVLNLLEAYVSKDEIISEQTHEEVREEGSTTELTKDEEVQGINEEKTIEGNESEVGQQSELDHQAEQAEHDPSFTVEETEDENFDSAETEEPAVKNVEDEQPNFVSADYDPFSEEIKERSYTNGLNAEKGTSNNLDETSESLPNDEDLNLEESEGTPVDNVNPNTKRKVAEQTANSILKGYAKLAPQPFKWFAKVDESKIEKLAFEGEININLEVSEGTTFDDYMKQTNEQIDEIFEVDEDTLDEIREPLIEVLLEQKLELTPQQRLMMAVVSHLFQMFTVALNLRRQNNKILEYQKRMTLMTAQKAA